MSATRCAFDILTRRCQECRLLSDCWDERYGFTIPVPEPLDGPMKPVPDRHRDGHTFRRRHGS
jgi:hypothetical protein